MLAIVLSRRAWREYDELISLYTYDRGRVEALAKSSKKLTSKQSAFFEPGQILNRYGNPRITAGRIEIIGVRTNLIEK